jgi:hypothetical protein
MRYLPRISMTTPEPQDQTPVGDPGCPACGLPILPGTPVGAAKGRMLHLDCYIAERETTRIAAMILERAVCVKCIVDKTGIEQSGVEAYVARMGAIVVVYTETEPCSFCANVGPVVSIVPS